MANYIDKIKKGETTYNIKQASYVANSGMNNLSSDFVAALKIGDTITNDDRMQIYTVTYDDGDQKTLVYIDEAIIECIVYMRNDEDKKWSYEESSSISMSINTLRKVIEFGDGITNVPADILNSVRAGDMLISNNDDGKLFICSFKNDNDASFVSLPDTVDSDDMYLCAYHKNNDEWSMKDYHNTRGTTLYLHTISDPDMYTFKLIMTNRSAIDFSNFADFTAFHTWLLSQNVISFKEISSDVESDVSFDAYSHMFVGAYIANKQLEIAVYDDWTLANTTDTVTRLY